MKTTGLRARRLEFAISFYSSARGSRTINHMRESSWSRVRRVGSVREPLRGDNP